MAISDARAIYGLHATGTPTSTNVSGSVTIGTQQTNARFTTADIAWSAQCLIASLSQNAVIDLTDGDTTGTTSWVGGTAQVETATIVAAAGCTSDGTMTLVVTSSGMSGSPLNVDVALTTTAHTTAALIAAAARTALEGTAVVAARFTIGGTGADITLTRLPSSTETFNGASVPIYVANDATLNLAIPGGLGVTAAASSVDTTAGVATSGAQWADADQLDFEGVTIATAATGYGLSVGCSLGTVDVTSAGVICAARVDAADPPAFFPGGAGILISDNPFTITPTADEPCIATVVFIGKTT